MRLKHPQESEVRAASSRSHTGIISFHNFAIPHSYVLCLASETTGEGSSNGDNASKKPLTEEEKLQQVKRSESAHQISILFSPQLVGKVCVSALVLLFFFFFFSPLVHVYSFKLCQVGGPDAG